MKNVNSYPKEVQEIHHAFENAGENILAEAQSILKDCETKTIDKGKRLLSLGFKQSKEAVIYTGIIGKETDAKKISELVIYYKVRYPNNKFITEKQVKSICDKWNLVCAPVDRFKGFVPEIKLKEIERFNVHGNDKRDMVCKNIKFTFNYVDENEQAALKRKYRNGIYPVPQRGEIEGANIKSYDLIDNQSLLICAPKKDMDLQGLQKLGAIFASFNTVTIPDPVVLQPVKGGYLIVAAWGDEATDENVVNQGMN